MIAHDKKFILAMNASVDLTFKFIRNK